MAKPPEISIDVFENIDNSRKLDIDLIASNEEDGLKICRELNCKWKNDMRFIIFAEKAPYMKKTLKSMLKQLDEFTKSKFMVDPKECIEKDLNASV